ncbi:uncharacterized protein IWZ02DRAFT_487281 [Phyllosticta citriasiana]|uniref:Uncharacterized protein n=1 Tax=Phyllosticta citriasiana TaxID=595635 RepID=A0ABR1KV68_9PEZI
MLASTVNKVVAGKCEQRAGYSSQQQQQQQQQRKKQKRQKRKQGQQGKAQEQEAPASNPHRDFYKDFGPPILKVFFGAFIVYQGLYYGWLKLEDIEKRHDSEAEIERLKTQIHEAHSQAKATTPQPDAAQDDSSPKRSWYKFW